MTLTAALVLCSPFLVLAAFVFAAGLSWMANQRRAQWLGDVALYLAICLAALAVLSIGK